MDTIASAAPVASAPAVAPVDRSDRDYVLLNLGRKFDAQLEEIARLDQVRDAQWRAFEAQRECYPLACRPRPGDVDLFGATFGEGERYDGAYSDRQVEEIRALTEAYASSGPPFRRQVLIRRGDEITQAHARWMAANDRLARKQVTGRTILVNWNGHTRLRPGQCARSWMCRLKRSQASR